ncbi:hypothetical protein AAFF_G00340480 [Aldrovandia affinis]|uniref:C2H2-type domain-containing protein n=1 Tax=Aldrovandia affinis TaxID=143900 RepID=A0AAD7SKV2_9TELE|nr:hypothetical protein AAFF_G00340480 [Aldrovandia affinis]
MMNGALYISFFQGQLESAMEHVVQLAVQEITKTVGSSLNSMLQETTIKDQENQRLRLRLQSRQSDGVENASACSGSNMEENAANDETKSLIHTPSQSSEHAVYANTHWLDQKGRAVGQLKAVMEQVLKFAVCEVTKIVEDSFDDLLLELMKKEKENRSLNVRLQSEEAGGTAENHSLSPTQGETQQQPFSSAHFGAGVLQEKKPTETPNVAEKQTVLSVAQDWVPILDKVFGQKWCSDLWQVKEMGSDMSELGIGMGVGSFPECIIQDEEDQSLLESGEGDAALQQQVERKAATTPGVSSTGSPGCSSPVAPEGQSHHHHGDDPQLRSPSMLHRLLTLPSQGLGQLLCTDPSIDPVLPTTAEASPEGLEAAKVVPRSPTKDPSPTPAEEEGATPAASCSPVEAEQRPPPAGRKTYACRQCGKKFGRLPLLKAHQQTHAEAAPTRCSLCGKRFAQAARLQAHLRTHAGKNP